MSCIVELSSCNTRAISCDVKRSIQNEALWPLAAMQASERYFGVMHSSGTATITDDYSSSTQYYNVIQCTGGTLTMNGCTITKTGDGSGGDNSSFYGNNSSIYAGAASSTNYQSTTAASGAKIVIKNVTVNGSAQGANAVIATNGATVEIDGITIVNDKSVSRGLHATYGGIITASNVDITTNEATSSTIATDLVGTSAKGEIAVIEGDNSITMTNCTMTSGSSERGLLMMQSGSGDASGVNPVMTITGTSLTMTDSSAPLLEVATCVTATCMLSGCTVTVPSGILMYVMADSQWSTSGAVGNLILDNGTYSGIVKYDTGYTANVTVNSGAVWNLTANTSIGTLVNNGTINCNGYTLTTTSTSGIINAAKGIEEIVNSQSSNSKSIYTLDGRCVDTSYKGIVIQQGKKYIRK